MGRDITRPPPRGCRSGGAKDHLERQQQRLDTEARSQAQASAWRKKWRVHPAADVFPMISARDWYLTCFSELDPNEQRREASKTADPLADLLKQTEARA